MSRSRYRVYFGHLPFDMDDRDARDFEDMVREFGRTREIKMLRGFAFVEFEDSRDASACVRELDDTKFLGERIQVEFAKISRFNGSDRGRDRERRFGGDSYKPRKHIAVVTGFPAEFTWKELKDLMRKAGEIMFADITNGEGIVEFKTSEDVAQAIKLYNGTEYQGSQLTVENQYERNRRRSRSPRQRSSSPRAKSRSRSPRTRSRSRSQERKESNPVSGDVSTADRDVRTDVRDEVDI